MILRFKWYVLAAAMVSTIQINAQQPGFLNVSVGSSPTISDVPQPLTLFGCNNTQVNTDVFWDTQNQIVGDIPYGPGVSESGKAYFISKYYVASPPAWRGINNQKYPFIGLVTPDRFEFAGDNPAQILYLDYRILKPTYLKHLPVNFSYQEGELPSCEAQGVTSIPINTACADFPWRIGAKGASGIGELSDNGGTAFLPFLDKDGQEPLQCNVTLLDDILLSHEMFFMIDGLWSKTIDMTALHQQNGTMELVCVPREPQDIPAGCAAP